MTRFDHTEFFFCSRLLRDCPLPLRDAPLPAEKPDYFCHSRHDDERKDGPDDEHDDAEQPEQADEADSGGSSVSGCCCD